MLEVFIPITVRIELLFTGFHVSSSYLHPSVSDMFLDVFSVDINLAFGFPFFFSNCKSSFGHEPQPLPLVPT